MPDLHLLLVRSRPAWHADALCREYPEVNFFPMRGQTAKPALTVCSQCIVRDECRAWALDQSGTLQGVWGGTTHRQRQRLRVAAA